METLTFLFVFLGPWLLLGYALYRIYFRNRFTVEPNNRERLVLQNVGTGTLKVLGPGTHFVAPWYKILTSVKLNREPVLVSGEEVKTSDGIRLEMDHRLDMISGRPFDPITGKLGVRHPVTGTFHPLSPDDLRAVTDDMVELAVTRINFDQRAERIQEIVRASIEEELGNYKADQLMTPQDVRSFPVPKQETPGGIVPRPVRTTSELYQQLAACTEERANRSLLHVGINIVDFRITNLRFKDDQLQGALENKKRMEKLAAAAKKVKKGSMTDREALAAGTDQFGTVTLAQAGISAAKAIGDGLRNFRRGP